MATFPPQNAENLPTLIRPAVLGEGDDLTRLALRSKSHWGYDSAYLDRCWAPLHIDDSYIQSWPVMVLERQGQRIGYYTLKKVKDEDRLDNLWIDLPYIGKGFGKTLLMDAMGRARTMGWKSFRLAADPKAEPFYLKYGAKKLGFVQSKLKPDLFLPHLEFNLE